MAVKLDEHRIVVSAKAMTDHAIEVMQDQFQAVSASLEGHAQNSDVEAYAVAVEELCRISRRIIWTFVCSARSNESQVRDVLSMLESLDCSHIDEFSPTQPTIGDFTAAIQKRALQLTVALESHEMDFESDTQRTGRTQANETDSPQVKPRSE
jgi:hypothetical protein